jgi:hypothetical protein
MKQSAVSGERLAVGRRILITFCLLLAACGSLNCGSVPNLEAAECNASRGVVKELYSFHFGNEMRFSGENLKQREKFLTPEFYRSLQGVTTDGDVLTTGGTDFPKAFRVGKCEVAAPDKTNIEVLLFWRDDARTEQRAINVETVRQGDKWLVNKVSNQ